jgi:hypothetical protein
MNNTQDKPVKRTTMDGRLQAHLGNQLRQLFVESASRPIPDQFTALLDRLESSTSMGETGPEKHSAVSNEVQI